MEGAKHGNIEYSLGVTTLEAGDQHISLTRELDQGRCRLSHITAVAVVVALLVGSHRRE